MSVQDKRSPETAVETTEEISAYARAEIPDKVEPREYFSILRDWARFCEAVIQQVGIESPTWSDGYLQLGTVLEPFNERRILDDEGWRTGTVFVYPDDTRQFVGADETAKENQGLFSYVIHPNDGLPMIRTVEEGYELLTPAGMDRALHDHSDEERQGEWWMLDPEEPPKSSVFKPGVGKRPFGGSPLGNHIPREWAMGVPDGVFMARVAEQMPEVLDFGTTPGEIFDTLGKAQTPARFPDVELITDVPDLAPLRELAEGIYVRGTLRHRENDHFLTTIGEEWKLAKTHRYDIEVYTPDQLGVSLTIRAD